MKDRDKPAFPMTPKRPWDNESENGFPGLTKLEYFAAKAMQGLCANSKFFVQHAPENRLIAEKSVEVASAIMAEIYNRTKTKT